MTFFIWCLTCYVVFGFILGEVQKKYLPAIILKCLASFGFVLMALSAIFERTNMVLSSHYVGASFIPSIPIALMFVAGLVSGLLGDVTLALRPLRPIEENQTIIFSGIVFFSIGHLFYLGALLLYGEFQLLSIVFSVVISAIIYTMSKVLKFQMGKLLIPTMVYSFLIFLMIGQVLFLKMNGDANTYLDVLLIGALLFGVSDLILAPIYFKGESRKRFIISNLVTYYFAQMLIAFSILFL
jgi:uncharacterized membrane protein YhhN